LLAIAAALVGLEALAYLARGPAEWIAARLWTLGGCGFLLLGSTAVARAAAGAARDRCLVSLTMVAVLCFAALWGITGVDHVQLQHEATQEIAAGLEGASAPGWAYTGVGHLGYPNRQYLIAAVPSLLLGRGLTSLRLGFALPFLLGAFVFWAGAREAWLRFPGGGAAAALATLSVPAFPYAIDHLRWYEQTSLPLSMTLAAAGWMLVAIRRPTIAALLGLAWIGALLGCSYTPALASSALLVAALVWLAARSWRLRERGLALGWSAVAVITLGFAGLSFITRLDLLKEVDQPTIRIELSEPLREAFAIFFLGHPRVFVPPVLYLPVMAVIVLGLIGRLRLAGLTIAWWTLAVIVASTVLTGYSIRPPSFDMLRSLVVIPPLLLLTGWTWLGHLRDCSDRLSSRVLVASMTALVLAQVVWNLAALDHEYRPRLHEIVLADMLERGRQLGISSDSQPAVVVLTGSDELDNINDFLMYFYPGHRVLRSAEEAAALDPGAQPFFVYADPDFGVNASLPWLEGHDGAVIDHRHPELPRRLIRWASIPASFTAQDTNGSGVQASEH
jgi:hypothetical protein